MLLDGRMVYTSAVKGVVCASKVVVRHGSSFVTLPLAPNKTGLPLKHWECVFSARRYISISHVNLKVLLLVHTTWSKLSPARRAGTLSGVD